MTPDIVLLRTEAIHGGQVWARQRAVSWLLLAEWVANPFDVLAHAAGHAQHDMNQHGVPISALRWEVVPYTFPKEDA